MRILRHPGPLPGELRGAVVALGNFDGVHRGHCSVIDRAAELAGRSGAPLGVVTFEPHPRSHFQGDGAAFRLTPFRQKMRLLDGLGLDLVVNLAFTPAMADRLAQDFVTDILLDGVAASHVVTGPGFVFGKDRRGNGYVLARMAEQERFDYTEVPPFAVQDRNVSSTAIRVLLRRGQVGQAAELLGHLWEFEARVEPGDRRGRELGFPTANQALDGVLHPGPGIYAVRAGLAQAGGTVWHDGAAYIGTRPTFRGETMLLETNLFDFSGDLYGRRLRVVFAERIRKDMTFRGEDALKRRMQEDCEHARDVLAALAGRSRDACGGPAP